MLRNIGDIYTDTTFRDVDGQMLECLAEFEVISIDVQEQVDGTTVTLENSKLVRYLD